MIIGAPREIKDNEYRVAITPAGVQAFLKSGHQVAAEAGAGTGSGVSDEDYSAAGARLLPVAKDVYEQADMVMKVKEPLRLWSVPVPEPGAGR